MIESGMFLARLWNDESGVSAVEYVLLLALVGSTVIIGASFLGQEVGLQLDETATCIQAGTNCVPG
ncbi:MAG: Flp family type IVb pilin [Alphaproteobacteria bacterium]